MYGRVRMYPSRYLAHNSFVIVEVLLISMLCMAPMCQWKGTTLRLQFGTRDPLCSFEIRINLNLLIDSPANTR